MSKILRIQVYCRARELENDPEQWKVWESELADSTAARVAQLFPMPVGKVGE